METVQREIVSNIFIIFTDSKYTSDPAMHAGVCEARPGITLLVRLSMAVQKAAVCGRQLSEELQWQIPL